MEYLYKETYSLITIWLPRVQFIWEGWINDSFKVMNWFHSILSRWPISFLKIIFNNIINSLIDGFSSIAIIILSEA